MLKIEICFRRLPPGFLSLLQYSGSFRPVLLKREGRKNGICRLLLPLTTMQAGGEKGIEYYRLKTATLAGKCQ
jgi:hypothetical protein